MSENSLAFAKSRIELVKSLTARYKELEDNADAVVRSDILDDAEWLFCPTDDGFMAASWELELKETESPAHFRPEFGFAGIPGAGHATFDVVIIQTKSGDIVDFRVGHQDIPPELVEKGFLGVPGNVGIEYVHLTDQETESFKLFVEYF